LLFLYPFAKKYKFYLNFMKSLLYYLMKMVNFIGNNFIEKKRIHRIFNNVKIKFKKKKSSVKHLLQNLLKI
jgi:hypothetical protein